MADPEKQPEQPKAVQQKQVIGKWFISSLIASDIHLKMYALMESHRIRFFAILAQHVHRNIHRNGFL